MNRLLCVMMVVAVLCAIAAGAGADAKSWRVKVCQIQPKASDLRDYDDSQGIGIEYSLGDTFAGEDSASEASVFFEYSRLRYTQSDTSSPLATVTARVKMNLYTVGVGWRFGPGAKASDDGLYAGFGTGISFGSPRITQANPGFGGLTDDDKTNFDWRVMAGLNFGGSAYSELTYRKVGSDGTYSLSAGMRF